MPRRKRGRAKPRGRRRDRSKDLPVLNIRAASKIGQPSAEVKPESRPESSRWRQGREPFPEDRTLEDVLGLYVMEGRHLVEKKKVVGEEVAA